MSEVEARGYAGRLAKDIDSHVPAVGILRNLRKLKEGMTEDYYRALGFHYLPDLKKATEQIGYVVSEDEENVYFTKMFGEDTSVILYVHKDSQYQAFHPYYECKEIADGNGRPIGMRYMSFTTSLSHRCKTRAYLWEARREVTIAMGYPDVEFMFAEPVIAMKKPSWIGGAVWVYANEALSLLSSYHDEERKRITDLLAAKTE